VWHVIEARRLLRLYPRAWRERYGVEMGDLLEHRPPSRRDAVDLVRGALDAHLHPTHASLVPAIAALTAGAAWTVVALAVLAEPVPPDWPGMLASTLPLAVLAVGAGLVALLGWLLAVGPGPRSERRAASAVGVTGMVVLLLALVLAAIGGVYGALTGGALAVGGVGCIALGGILVSRGATVPGDLVIVAGAAWLLPPPWAWLLAAVAWSGLGLAMIVDRERRRRWGRTLPA
jgi:hypothetical protein